MALSFQWDEIRFRKATAGWKPMARMVYREILPWLHLNDGSVTARQLDVGYRDFGLDPKTWRRWIAFIVGEGKLVKTSSGEWTNERVSRDHERITRRRSATVGDKPQKSPEQSSTESRASTPPLQGTGIQDTGILTTSERTPLARKKNPPLIDLQTDDKNNGVHFPEIPEFLDRREARPDPCLKDSIFGPCLTWLGDHSDRPRDKLRSLVGRWCRDHGDGQTLQAMIDAQRAAPVEPVAWITKTLATNDPASTAVADEQLETLTAEWDSLHGNG